MIVLPVLHHVTWSKHTALEDTKREQLQPLNLRNSSVFLMLNALQKYAEFDKFSSIHKKNFSRLEQAVRTP